jgi:hypothetical protein
MRARRIPVRGVYSVVKERGKRARMIRIGLAMFGSDSSIMVCLDTFPLSGTLLIRELSDTESLSTQIYEVVKPTTCGSCPP